MYSIMVAHDRDIRMIDRTSIRMQHQHAPTAERGVGPSSRSLAVRSHDQDSRGLRSERSPAPAGPDRGSVHDAPSALTLLDRIRPLTIALGGKAHDGNAIPRPDRAQRAVPNIQTKSDRPQVGALL
jgi:hypothetical protein